MEKCIISIIWIKRNEEHKKNQGLSANFVKNKKNLILHMNYKNKIIKIIGLR